MRFQPIVRLGLLLACAMPGLAFRRAGTSAAPFLKLDQDARATALAGAGVALPGAFRADGAGAGNAFLNPAGLAGLERRQLALSHEKRFAGLTHGLLQAAWPLSPRSALWAGANWLAAPDQEITTLEEPEGTGADYSYRDLSLNLGAASRLTDRLSVGASARWVRQELHRETAQGPALDLGLLLDTGWRDLRLGIALANFGPRLSLEGEDLLVSSDDGRPSRLEMGEYPLPLLFRVGVSDRLWSAGEHALDGMLQAEHPNDGRENLRLGLEYAWRDRLRLRAGRHLRRDEEQGALGMGIEWPLADGRRLSLDWAWTSRARLAASHVLSASLAW